MTVGVTAKHASKLHFPSFIPSELPFDALITSLHHLYIHFVVFSIIIEMIHIENVYKSNQMKKRRTLMVFLDSKVLYVIQVDLHLLPVISSSHFAKKS